MMKTMFGEAIDADTVIVCTKFGYVRRVPDHTALIEYYRSYGESSFATDMPAYAEICRNLASHPELLDLVAAHDPDAQQPNLLFAAVHYLLLQGLEHALADVYDGTSDAAPTALFADLVLSHQPAIDELLETRRTQTNEVGRCALLAPMLIDAQRRTGQPLAWIDLGASGGLNLNVDRYHIEYRGDTGGVSETGPADSLVQLSCDVRAGSPPIEANHASIEWRLGIDRAPIDVAAPHQALWLKACLWPSQRVRHDRLDAAISVARDFPPNVIRADAAEGIAAAIAEAPSDSALVMTTTWVWYYLPTETKHAVLSAITDSGRSVWWYSLEGRGVVAELGQGPGHDVAQSQLGLIEFGSSAQLESRLIGSAHPHGAWLNWQ